MKKLKFCSIIANLCDLSFYEPLKKNVEPLMTVAASILALRHHSVLDWELYDEFVLCT